MPILNQIPTTPDEGAYWNPSTPFATYPAAAHAMMHAGQPQESRWSAVDYMKHMQGRNNPYYLMQKYWPAGASQVQALQGLGADEGSGVLAVVAGAALMVAVVGLGASVAAGYYAGKAIAPSDDQASTYGKIGAAVAILGAFAPSPLSVSAGVGGMAAVSHHMSNRGALWTIKSTKGTKGASSRERRGTTASETSPLPRRPKRRPLLRRRVPCLLRNRLLRLLAPCRSLLRQPLRRFKFPTKRTRSSRA